jgi:hypothetical protein
MATTQKPIYFVLGNHDYYRRGVDDVRSKMTSITKDGLFLFWLPALGPQKLDNDVVLVGQDCFADGRYGDYTNSRVVLNDSRMIVDLFQCGNYRLALLEKPIKLQEIEFTTSPVATDIDFLTQCQSQFKIYKSSNLYHYSGFLSLKNA